MFMQTLIEFIQQTLIEKKDRLMGLPS